MNVMTALLRATGWDKKLVETLDHKYEAQEHETEPRRFNGVAGRFNEAQHRYFGFTGFVETDVSLQKSGVFLHLLWALLEPSLTLTRLWLQSVLR